MNSIVIIASGLVFYAVCELLLHKLRPLPTSRTSALAFWIGFFQPVIACGIVIAGLIAYFNSQ